MIQAIETGFSHIDSAQCTSSRSFSESQTHPYEPLNPHQQPGYRTEDSVGRAIRETALDRSELYITTKWSGLTTVPEAIQTSLEEVRPSLHAYLSDMLWTMWPCSSASSKSIYTLYTTLHLLQTWRRHGGNLRRFVILAWPSTHARLLLLCRCSKISQEHWRE